MGCSSGALVVFAAVEGAVIGRGRGAGIAGKGGRASLFLDSASVALYFDELWKSISAPK